jgi:hypothetical protein
MYIDQSASLSATTHSEPPTTNHFHLKGDHNAYFQEEVLVDFQPVKAIDAQQSPQRLTTFSIIPTFNPDGKYYTTAFLNPFDDEIEEDGKMLSQHQTKVKEYSTEIALNDIVCLLIFSFCPNRGIPIPSAASASNVTRIIWRYFSHKLAYQHLQARATDEKFKMD